jgi:hypothetical protein
VVVKNFSLSGSIERHQIDTEVENLLNLRHPMIAPLIGCVFPVESSGQREFRTVRLYATDGPLADVLSNPPIIAGLDSDEVSAFISCVELLEQAGERQ